MNPATTLLVATRGWLTTEGTPSLAGFLIVTHIHRPLLDSGLGPVSLSDAALNRAYWRLKYP